MDGIDGLKAAILSELSTTRVAEIFEKERSIDDKTFEHAADEMTDSLRAKGIRSHELERAAYMALGYSFGYNDCSEASKRLQPLLNGIENRRNSKN